MYETASGVTDASAEEETAAEDVSSGWAEDVASALEYATELVATDDTSAADDEDGTTEASVAGTEG